MSEPTPPEPTPGSHDARALGCKCPVIDNHYGSGMPYSNGPRFWVAGDCELHGSRELVTTERKEPA